jgi:CRP/FNR family transcriptional regulator, cyclic AMP receptor protein
MATSIGFRATSAAQKAIHANGLRLWPRDGEFTPTFSEHQTINPPVFIQCPGIAAKIAEYGAKETIFTQDDPATSVLFIQEGDVKLGVVDESGKEAVAAVLGPGDFLGEGCLAGQARRASTAIAITPTTIVMIEKLEMIRVLHEQHEFSDRFIAYTIARHFRDEENLVDQIFNCAEKRLARTLLLIAGHGPQERCGKIVSGISQETLAEMIGTTRSQVNRFMNKFKRLGFIEYHGRMRGLQINNSLQSVVLGSGA